MVHDLDEAEKHCQACEQELREFGEETSERYEYIPAQLIVIEDVCKKYSCACTVKTAGEPSQPIEKSTAGASLLTQVIVAKYADHLPLPRQVLQSGVDIVARHRPIISGISFMASGGSTGYTQSPPPAAIFWKVRTGILRPVVAPARSARR